MDIRISWWYLLVFLLATISTSNAQDYTYTISGQAITITKYNGSDAAVTIPSSFPDRPGMLVRCIWDYAFSNSTSLTSIIIPSTVTNMGQWVFKECINLSSVTISNTIIGYYAFYGCTNLTSVAIPYILTTIKDGAFWGCSRLTSISLPGTVASIGSAVFYDCTSLTAINVSGGNAVYSSANGVLFNKPKTTLIRYPAGKSGTYTIPTTVTSIPGGAFQNCTSLASLAIPSSVTDIADNFYNCTNLTAFTVDTANTVYSSANGVLFNYYKTSLIQCPGGKSGSFTIPSTVTSMGQYAFYICPKLTEILVATGNTKYTSIGGVVFNNSQTMIVQCPGGMTGTYTIPNVTVIGDRAFRYCTSLNGITIPSGVTKIFSEGFAYCIGLTNIIIPDSVTSIADSAFYGCSSLVAATIGSSVTNIGSWGFNSCVNLKEVYFRGKAPTVTPSLFYGDGDVTVYYLPSKSGWGSTLGGKTTALWNPKVVGDESFGVNADQFGFNIIWTKGVLIVVEACTNLIDSSWSQVQSNTLASDSFYFRDTNWMNYPARYYRIISP